MLLEIAEKLDAFVVQRGRRVRAGASSPGQLQAVLTDLLKVVETAVGGSMLTSVLRLDQETGQLRHLAAPSLPPSYCQAIDGVAIGPAVGSCGTAAYLGHAIYVADIASDPLWRDFAHLAAEHGLAACWSTPIEAAEGGVLGTYAIYYRERRTPTSEEIKAIALITQVVRHEIERTPPPVNT